MTLSRFRDHSTPAGLLLACLLALPACNRPPARPVTIAAAADLQFAMEDVLREFRRSHPAAAIRADYGSSGNFYSQIRNQAPFDLFLSADVQYPRRLLSEGLAVPDSLFAYATGRIVIWAPDASPIDIARLGWAALDDPAVRHIAIANPEHAPYGRAAVAAMKSAGIYDRVAPKFVLGENIAQTFQFVQSGAADIGIVALSLALAPSVHGKYWEVPPASSPAIQQAGVILSRAKDSRTARDLRDFLVSPPGRAILKRYGFSPPEN